MSTTLTELQQWMAARSETEHLEFKEAANQFDFNKLLHYCGALANEGGGVLILGVTNKPPRRIAGTRAFPNLEKVKGDLYQRLHFRVDVDELNDPNGRVLVFRVPPRPVGQPVRVDRIYWMRAGESLTEMSEDRLKQIFAETDKGLDFTGKICADARLDDLEPAALEDFRRRWLAKSGNARLASLGVEQLLADAELAVERQLSRGENKGLLLSHLKHYGRGRMEEFQQVLPSLSRNQILSLLKELKDERKTEFVGITRHGHWILKPQASSPRKRIETHRNA